MSLSPGAVDALKLVSDLQSRFVEGLEAVSQGLGDSIRFEKTEWLRDEGTHGGGNRLTAPEGGIFNRASVNVSQIHYDNQPEKKLGSATAISTIIHPANPHAPSVHIHISWTEMKDGNGYWRIMGDLNPSIVHPEFRDVFRDAMQKAAPAQYEEGSAQGDRYFFIPALDRHRGVTHFYLESYRTDDRDADRELARKFGETVIDTYLAILEQAMAQYPQIESADWDAQLAYHTLYLFQVLTLDRGTTSGLLVHDQNDVGIMGSLPSHVDRELLKSWSGEVAVPQDNLVKQLVDCLPNENPSPVNEKAKRDLAAAVRNHYQRHPEALEMQARGNVIPPTVNNHS